jgi:arylsulfatase A-like enzyme
LAATAHTPAAPAFAQQAKPNILFILAGNTGYGDIGAYGGGELRGAPGHFARTKTTLNF